LDTIFDIFIWKTVWTNIPFLAANEIETVKKRGLVDVKNGHG